MTDARRAGPVTHRAGPDVVIAGAARSGTTSLASLLGAHPDIVTPSIKEPNYFSSRQDRGVEWYRGLFGSGDGLWLDSSAQYGIPRYLHCLDDVVGASPDVKFVFIGREPVERAYSHFCHEVLYMNLYPYRTFGEGLAGCEDFAGGSDYARIVAKLYSLVPTENVLVLPFEAIRQQPAVAASLVWGLCKLSDAPDGPAAVDDASLFHNERLVIRSPVVRGMFNRLRGTTLYPRLRRVVGARRMRYLRSRLGSGDGIPSLQAALQTCTPEQRAELDRLRAKTSVVFGQVLEDQDTRLGTDLARLCSWI